MISSGIKYSGKVTVKIKNKPPVKVRNNGTNALFNLIYDILGFSGQPYDCDESWVNRTPGYMMLLHKNSFTSIDDLTASIDKDNSYSKYVENTLLLKPMEIEERIVPQEEENNDYTPDDKYVTFKCFLTKGNIYSSVLNNCKEQEGLVILLDRNRHNILAYVKIKLEAFESVNADSEGQAIIEWNMDFSNSKAVN